MSEIYTKDGVRESHCQRWVRYDDHARELAKLRAAIVSTQAERDALKQDIEDKVRNIESLQLKVDTAHRHIGELMAREERAEAAWARCAALCDALLWEGPRPACMTEQQRAIAAARAAVDAAGDLEVPK